MYKKLVFSISIFIYLVFPSKGQVNFENGFSKEELEEFEFLNLCHCVEYMLLRHYDYVAWKSEESKQRYLDEYVGVALRLFRTHRLHSQKNQLKYDSSRFLKKGISIYADRGELNFDRLDSLYYEPIVQHYVTVTSRSEQLPYLGLDFNFYFDCFYTIKEILLEQELGYFLKANPQPPL